MSSSVSSRQLVRDLDRLPFLSCLLEELLTDREPLAEGVRPDLGRLVAEPSRFLSIIE